MVLINILFFAAGLFLLVHGSEFLVKSAASIAKKFGVSELIIGLTLVALGTSIPELASAVIASIRHDSGLIIGNVVGANIANICLIIGLAGALGFIKTTKEMLKRDGYLMLAVAVLMYVFVLNGTISKLEGAIFLLLYLAYVFFLYETKGEHEEKRHFREFIKYFFGFKYMVTIKSRLISEFNNMKSKNLAPQAKSQIKELFKAGIIKDILIIALSGVAIVLGANYFITSAANFAELFNVPHTVIGLSLVSLGTTLPELAVSVSAARKGFGDIAIGNVLGSNITNVLLVLGVAGSIHPLSILNITKFFSGPYLLLMSILFLFFIKNKWYIRKREALALLFLYVLFILFLFFVFSHY